MDRKLINPLIVTGIADAVRAKGKTTEPIKVADLPEAIMNLPEGGGVGEDTSALLDAIGVESREDTGMANGLAVALTDAPLESSWSGERTTADGAPIKDGVAFVSALKGKTMKVGRLPIDYQEVEYLESHGEEFIETDLIFSTPITVRGKIAYLGDIPQSNTSIFSPFGLTSAGNYIGIGAEGLWGFAGGRNLETPYTEVLEFTFTKASATALSYITDGKSTNSRAGSMSTASPMNLFKTSATSVPRLLKIYHIAVDDNNNSVDLVPCYRKSDGEAGMYDMVSGTFYTNSGTGTFTYGAEIGELQSSKPTAVVSKGRNIANIATQLYSNRLLATCTIPVKPNTNYTITAENPNATFGIFGLNDNYENLTPSQVWNSGSQLGTVNLGTDTNTFNTDNFNYIVFRLWKELSAYGMSGNEKICIAQGTGTYTPYIAPSRLDFDLTTIVDAQGNQLFPDGELRSAGSVHDLVDYANNVAEKGIGKAKISQLTTARASYSNIAYLAITAPTDCISLPSGRVPFDSIYPCYANSGAGWNSATNIGTLRRSATNQWYLGFAPETTLEQMRNQVADVEIFYELATPTEAEFTPTKSFYPVQSNGAEEAITDTIVPMNADIRYRVDTESLLTQSTALLAYSNEVTGAKNTSLGDAVKTLTDNYK